MPPYKYGGVASLNKVSSLFNGSFPSHCYQLIAHGGSSDCWRSLYYCGLLMLQFKGTLRQPLL